MQTEGCANVLKIMCLSRIMRKALREFIRHFSLKNFKVFDIPAIRSVFIPSVKNASY